LCATCCCCCCCGGGGSGSGGGDGGCGTVCASSTLRRGLTAAICTLLPLPRCCCLPRSCILLRALLWRQGRTQASKCCQLPAHVSLSAWPDKAAFVAVVVWRCGEAGNRAGGTALLLLLLLLSNAVVVVIKAVQLRIAQLHHLIRLQRQLSSKPQLVVIVVVVVCCCCCCLCLGTWWLHTALPSCCCCSVGSTRAHRLLLLLLLLLLRGLLGRAHLPLPRTHSSGGSRGQQRQRHCLCYVAPALG
jgi:hypothetical protein